MTAETVPPSSTNLVSDARRRRTFAVISHPDAGKSTLTEALALHARIVSEAGAIHGKTGFAAVDRGGRHSGTTGRDWELRPA